MIPYLDWIEKQVAAGKFDKLSDKARHYYLKVHGPPKPDICPVCGGGPVQFWTKRNEWLCRSCVLSKKGPGCSSTQFKQGHKPLNKKGP